MCDFLGMKIPRELKVLIQVHVFWLSQGGLNMTGQRGHSSGDYGGGSAMKGRGLPLGGPGLGALLPPSYSGEGGYRC